MNRKVIFIRHGESLANVDPKYYTYPDAAVILSQRGVDQCLELRNRIRTLLPRDHYGVHTQVVTSQYVRAKLTQQIVLADENLRLPVIHDARLNETYHAAHDVCEESREEVIARVRSLVEQHPFHLVLFCHGMLMGQVDLKLGGARNCEARVYDRDDLLNNYLK